MYNCVCLFFRLSLFTYQRKVTNQGSVARSRGIWFLPLHLGTYTENFWIGWLLIWFIFQMGSLAFKIGVLDGKFSLNKIIFTLIYAFIQSHLIRKFWEKDYWKSYFCIWFFFFVKTHISVLIELSHIRIDHACMYTYIWVLSLLCMYTLHFSDCWSRSCMYNVHMSN